MSALEATTTFTGGALMAPMRGSAGWVNTTIGSALEGLGYGSQDAANRGEIPEAKDLAIAIALSGIGRGIENKYLTNAERFAASKAKALGEDIFAREKANRKAADLLKLDVNAGIDNYIPTESAVTPFDEYITQRRADDARTSYQEQMARTGQPSYRARAAAETLVPEGPIVPVKSAASSAEAFTQLTDREKKIADFNAAREEETRMALKNEIESNQVGSGESTVFETPAIAQQTRLDVDLGRGSGATRERTRLLNQADIAEPTVAGKAFEREQAKIDRVSMSAQANRMQQEYGNIDPVLMMGVGRVVGGAAIGSYFGDTPDEKIGYGLFGALTGGLVAPRLINKAYGAALKSADTIKKAKGIWLPKLVLGPLMPIIDKANAKQTSELYTSLLSSKQLIKAFNKYTNPEARQKAQDMVYQYMTGAKQLHELPPDLQVAQNAKDAVVAASDYGIKVGLFQGKMKDTVLSNQDSYLRRSYRLFNDQGYRPPLETFDRWVKLHALDESMIPGNTRTMPELVQHYTNEANNLLHVDKSNAKNFIFTGELPRADKSIFMQRDPNLHAVTRELLGEIKDPLILLHDTVPRIVKTAATYQWQKEAASLGEHLGMMSKNSDNVKYTVPFTLSKDPFNPLSGYYTSPELKAAFDNISSDVPSSLMKALGTLSAATKFPKVIGSVISYSTNFVNAISDVISQGHGFSFLDKNGRYMAMNSIKADLGLMDTNGRFINSAAINLHKKLLAEGLFPGSVSSRDFIKTFDDSYFHKANTAGDNVLNFFGNLYGAPENAGKMINLAGELKTLNKAYPHLTADERFSMAAAIVRQTTTSYDALPKIIKTASKGLGLDPFVAYTADRYRTVYNTYKIALNEINSGNPVLIKSGFRRIAAMTTMIAVPAAIAYNSGVPENIREALRSKAKTYDRDGLLLFTPPDKKGNYSYTNLSYIFPSAIVTQAALSALRGDDPIKAGKNFLSSFGEQFLGGPLWLQPMLDIKDRVKYGKPVYSKLDELLVPNKYFAGETTQIGKAGKYLINELFIPGAVSFAKDFINTNEGEITKPSGRIVTKKSLLQSLAGWRVFTYNLAATTESEAKSFASQANEIATDYKKEIETSLTDKEKNDAYQNFDRRNQVVYNNVRKWVENSHKLGMSYDQIAELGKKGGMSSQNLLGAIDGIYVKPRQVEEQSASEQIVSWFEKKMTNEQIIAKINDISKTRPIVADALGKAFEANSRKAYLAASPTDRLLLGFNSIDGSRANYVAQQLAVRQQTEGRMLANAHIFSLLSKGILNSIDNFYLETNHGIKAKKP